MPVTEQVKETGQEALERGKQVAQETLATPKKPLLRAGRNWARTWPMSSSRPRETWPTPEAQPALTDDGWAVTKRGAAQPIQPSRTPNGPGGPSADVTQTMTRTPERLLGRSAVPQRGPVPSGHLVGTPGGSVQPGPGVTTGSAKPFGQPSPGPLRRAVGARARRPSPGRDGVAPACVKPRSCRLRVSRTVGVGISAHDAACRTRTLPKQGLAACAAAPSGGPGRARGRCCIRGRREPLPNPAHVGGTRPCLGDT